MGNAMPTDTIYFRQTDRQTDRQRERQRVRAANVLKYQELNGEAKGEGIGMSPTGEAMYLKLSHISSRSCA
jgi:endonuclease/exonuclease/phosphatase family metal-dependent hydrolase